MHFMDFVCGATHDLWQSRLQFFSTLINILVKLGIELQLSELNLNL